MTGKKIIKSPDTLRLDRVPPGQRTVTTLPVLHYGRVPRVDIATWTFTLSGLVTRPQTLSFKAFGALPRVEVKADIHCVTTWSRLDTVWEGVAASTIAGLAGPKPEAKFVMVTSLDGYSTNLPLKEFLEEDVLFATTFGGQTLEPEHGYPVRLVTPRLYFWKSAKWASGVEFMEHDRPGFWESRGYHNHGDPWKEERYG